MKNFCNLFTIVLLFSSQALKAQTIVVNPSGDGGFENGTTFAANGWTLVNNANNLYNNWRIANATLTSGTSSFAPSGTRSAFISQSTTGLNWSYDLNNYSTTHFYRDVTFPAGQNEIKLKFRWNAKGEGNAAQAYDVLYVYLCPTTLTPVTNSPFGTSSLPNWSGTGTATLYGAYHSCPTNNGQTAIITLPAYLAGSTQRLVFTWKNGNNSGLQPPAAVDSIALTTDCPRSTIAIDTPTTPCGNSITLSTQITNYASGGSYQWFVNNTAISGATSASFTSTTLQPGNLVSCVYYTNNTCGYTDTAKWTVSMGQMNYAIENLTICSNKLPKTWRGVNIPANATSNASFATVSVPSTTTGCDTVITLNLLVKPAPQPKTEYISLCKNQLPVVWRGKTIPATAYTKAKYDSVYAAAPNGCDSLIYLNLSVIDMATKLQQTIQGCEKVVHNNKVYYQDTILRDTFRTSSGCDSVIQNTYVIVDNFDLQLQQTPDSVAIGEYVKLQSTANSAYQILSWQPTNLFPDQTAYVQNIMAPDFAPITVIAKSDKGCLDTARLNLDGLPVFKDIRIPNAFSPNGDGRNDVFAPIFKMNHSYTLITFEVYDRWGNKVYGAYMNKGKGGWDGTYKNVPVNTGTYFYYIVVAFFDKTTATYKGDVTLIR